MKFHFPLTMKAAAEASCAIAAAVLSIQALAAVNPGVQDYARRAAAEGIVMLKNDNDVLPLGKNGPEKVAFFGITDPDTTGPLGSAPIRILQHSARRTRDIPRNSPEAEAALRAITPDEAFAALSPLLA